MKFSSYVGVAYPYIASMSPWGWGGYGTPGGYYYNATGYSPGYAAQSYYPAGFSTPAPSPPVSSPPREALRVAPPPQPAQSVDALWQMFGTPQPGTRHQHRNNMDTASRLGALATAAGFILAGLLLHRLPARNLPRFSLISTDWKDWARIILGIAAVGKVNKAFDWNPPPWLGALQAVAVINPLALGFSRRSLGQMVVMAPIVAGVVQGASILNNKLDETLEEKAGIPSLLTRLAISAVAIVLGVKAYPHVLHHASRMGILGQAAKAEAQKAAAGRVILAPKPWFAPEDAARPLSV